jgi:hypothetical protein
MQILPKLGAAPATGTASDRSFPQFADCKTVGIDASRFNESLLKSKGTSNLPFEPGNRRLNIKDYRCALLAEVNQPKSGGRRVLDLPNWLDCRIDPAPDVSVLINEAIIAYGQGGAAFREPGALDKILQDLDDQLEGASGNQREQLGAFANLIKLLGPGFPRQGSTARQNLEGAIEIFWTMLDSLMEILKEVLKSYVPSSGNIIDNVKKILKSLVDMLFFIGDFVAENYALRQEIAARFLSEQRAVGFPSTNPEKNFPGVRSIYSQTYGPETAKEGLVTAAPAMVTVRAWCKAGEDRNDPFFMPNGTTGKFNKAKNDYEAKVKTIRAALGPIKAVFGDPNNPDAPPTDTQLREFFGMVFVLGSWFKIYDGGLEVRDYLIGRKLREAVDSGNAEKTVVDLGITPATVAAVQASSEERMASVWIEAGRCCDSHYYVPFWEDTDGINFNFVLNTSTPFQERLDIRRKLSEFMRQIWGNPTDTKYCSTFCGGHAYRKWRGYRIDTFARKMMTVWEMLDAWAKASQPYYGVKRRTRLIEGLLTKVPKGDAGDPDSYGASSESRIPALFELATRATGFTWEQAILSAFVPGGQLGRPPQADDPAFRGVTARCPGGPNDKSCLPCEKIKQRRPIGAKAIDIPMLVEYTGMFPRLSLEYQNWVTNLRQNGYPDYYIDCLTQDLLLVSKGTGSGFFVRDSPALMAISTPPMAVMKLSGMSSRPQTANRLSGLDLDRPSSKPTEAYKFKMNAAKQGYINVAKARKLGLIPETSPDREPGSLAGAPTATPSGLSTGTKTALAIAGIAAVYLLAGRRA